MLKVEEALIGELDGKVTYLNDIVKSIATDLDKIPEIEDEVKELNISIEGLKDLVLKIKSK